MHIETLLFLSVILNLFFIVNHFTKLQKSEVVPKTSYRLEDLYKTCIIVDTEYGELKAFVWDNDENLKLIYLKFDSEHAFLDDNYSYSHEFFENRIAA